MKAVVDQKRQTELDRDALHDAVRSVMQTAHGRTLSWWLLEQCGIYTQNVSANSTMYILEGQRSVGLKFMELVGEVDPTIIPEMLLEKGRAEKALRKGGLKGPSHVTDEE